MSVTAEELALHFDGLSDHRVDLPTGSELALVVEVENHMTSETDALRGAIVEWAEATPRIRRLWIGPAALGTDPADGGITVAVEPRAVGDSHETLPVWVANCDAWHQQVQARTGRSVRLEWYDPNEPPGTGGKALIYDIDRF